MNTSPWAPYRPSDAAPWNLERAWTLRRRAGFAATWAELERDLAGGPGPAVDRVLAGECRIERRSRRLRQDGRLARRRGRRLVRPAAAPGVVALSGPLHARPARRTAQRSPGTTTSRPASSRWTTSPRCDSRMKSFSGWAEARSATCCTQMLRDPALLIWLDAPANRKGKPNENLARELMELFTLGVGRYTENDVKEAARALTGLTVAQGRFQLSNSRPRRRREDDPRQDRPVRRSIRWPTTFSPSPRPPTGSPGGSVRRSWAKGSPTRRLKPASPISSGATVCTSGGRSRRFSARRSSSPPRTCTPASPTRSALSSARCGLWSSLLRRPARCCSPSGRAGSVRSCSSRPTSAAGRAAGAGFQAAGSWRGPTSRRRSPWAGSASARDPPDLSALAARHGRGKDPVEALRYFGELLNGRRRGPGAGRIALAGRRRNRAPIPSGSTVRSPCSVWRTRT